MKCLSLASVVLMGMVHTAAAQAPGAAEPVSAPFLEKRVPEELAVEGVVLSRRNLGLQIEQIGDKWLASLVDLTTGRVAASTKVDTLPPDREAAVASMTHVVADLAAQIVGRTEAPPAPTPPVAPAPQPELVDDRAEQAAREVAELKFKRQSIRFGTTYLVAERTATVSTVSNSRNWAAFQGDLDQQLEPEDFYRQVGRPDLIEPYRRRRKHMIGGFIVAGIGAATVLTILARGAMEDSCSQTRGAVDDCVGNDIPIWHPLLAFAVTFAGGVYGTYYGRNLHPITENEAKALADAYNQKLRGQLRLPVVARRPILRDIRLTPYLTGHEGGVALGARF